MRFYQTVAEDGQETEVQWGSTQADAVAARKEYVAAGYPRKGVSTNEIDVPTDKAGLLAFLSANVQVKVQP